MKREKMTVSPVEKTMELHCLEARSDKVLRQSSQLCLSFRKKSLELSFLTTKKQSTQNNLKREKAESCFAGIPVTRGKIPHCMDSAFISFIGLSRMLHIFLQESAEKGFVAQRSRLRASGSSCTA